MDISKNEKIGHKKMTKRGMKSLAFALASTLTLLQSGGFSMPNAIAGTVKEAPAPEAKLVIPSPLIPVTRDFKLKNGLRVVLSEDHKVPVAAVAIIYDVGARDEEKGKSGFAHLFEHMMFEGSENVAKNEHSKYLESVGGTDNASTHPDFTNYFEKLPSNQLELALWLEADRMRSLQVTKENFDNQLETVKEEKRTRYDNQAYSPAFIKFQEVLFDNWQNSHPVIGSFEDLESANVEYAKKFFKTYYAPNNAVMAIVGDFNSDEVEKLVHKYFDSIPSSERPAPADVSEPKQTKQKKVVMEDKHAQVPAVVIGWKAPGRREKDYYAMGILEQLLSSGDSSRLYQRMVKGDKVALEASAGSQERRGPGFFYTFVLYKPENKPEKIRQIVFNELDKFKTQPVSQEELEKARNQILRGLFSSGSYSSLQRSSGKAELLAEYTSFFGDPKTIDEDLEAYMKVTPQDVQRVAKSLFDENGATIVDIIPADKEEKPQDKADQDAKSKQEKSKKSAASTKETKAKGKS